MCNIDNAQTAMAEANVLCDKDATIIWAAMMEYVPHAREYIRRNFSA